MTPKFKTLAVAAILSAAVFGPAAAEITQAEVDVLVLINQHRAAGAVCPSGAQFGPAPELLPSANLFEAAQRWSYEQLSVDTMSHGDFSSRIYAVCDNPGMIAENVAGNPGAQSVVQAWMNSDGHCKNIMNPNFARAGVGNAPGGTYGGYWTLKFASSMECY